MEQVNVLCACGRAMAVVGSLGPNHYRCSHCRTRVQVTVPAIDENEKRCTRQYGRSRCSATRHQDLHLCLIHAIDITKRAIRDDQVREQLANDIAGARYLAEENAAIRRAVEDGERRRIEARAQMDRVRPACPLVYYLRIGDNHIKIGTTGYLRQRMEAYRILDDRDLLAVEPGDVKLEHARHQEFDQDRYHHRREDFREGDALMEHIARLRATYGPPMEYYDAQLAAARAQR